MSVKTLLCCNFFVLVVTGSLALAKAHIVIYSLGPVYEPWALATFETQLKSN